MQRTRRRTLSLPWLTTTVLLSWTPPTSPSSPTNQVRWSYSQNVYAYAYMLTGLDISIPELWEAN